MSVKIFYKTVKKPPTHLPSQFNYYITFKITSYYKCRILEALETVVENIPITNSSEPEIIPLKSFAVAALLVDIKDIKVSGQNFSINSREITEDNLSFGTRTDNAAASISLPNTILYNVTDITNSTRITHSVFLFDSLFLRRSENYLEVGSIIISASVVGKTLRGLRDPVSLNFLINSVSLPIYLVTFYCCILIS